MKFNNKHYKLKKTKLYFEKESIFFIYTSNNFNSKKNLELKQNFKKLNLTSLTIKNKLTKKFIKKSIFKNFSIIITGPICIIKPTTNLKHTETFKKLINLDNSLTFIGLKINNRIYSVNQIKTLNFLNYSQNIISFTQTLNKLIKLPYYKLNNNSK